MLDYTGSLYGTKFLGRKKIWTGSVTRKVLNNFLNGFWVEVNGDDVNMQVNDGFCLLL